MSGSAIVIGGGIGGLAAALGLRRIGWGATVLERTAELGEIGAGMSQSPNALRALEELGVAEQARAAGVPFHGVFNLRAPSGDYITRALPGGASPLLGFHRADLHRVLMDAVPAQWVRTGAEVTAIRQSGGEVTVSCGDEELRADLVVAADGVRSTVRRLLWPEAPGPRFWGNTIWRGIAKAEGIEGSMTLGRGQYFLVMPVGRGRVYWALGAHAGRPAVRYDDELAEVRRRARDWHDPIPRLLDATAPEAVLHHDITDLGPLDSYARGRVVLLGDAAHAMHPDMAQGAAQSLEDAVVLAAALAEAGDIPAALSRYDEQRRPRTQTIVKQARTKGRGSTSSNAVSYYLRTLTLRMVPSSRWPGLAARALAPVWDWTPPRLPR
ncbi:FAD-dependent monooxygenase [Streptosporangium sp. NBC_01756]|uniref:FAD-dependent monooxygenase n=1 Tax=Streptosporangium sp. NBC_01756 TaxID=2975950 RepID=UPI002DDAAFD6|nr:FAD-dependent monooxygenase [Streptosporangium sp. NBC_01756]WSC89602.1 FAD-dependent monooxygenase [Streptosporangium sp. NBC_01756]